MIWFAPFVCIRINVLWTASLHRRIKSTMYACTLPQCIYRQSTNVAPITQDNEGEVLVSTPSWVDHVSCAAQRSKFKIPLPRSFVARLTSLTCCTVSTLDRHVTLRSVDNNDLFIFRSRMRPGERAFRIAAHRAWNSLSSDVREQIGYC